MSSTFKAFAALIFTVVIWGFAPAFVRSFSLTAGPGESMFIRLISVALMCLPLLPFVGVHIARRDWPRFLLVAWVGIFGYFLGSIFGFTYVTSGVGGLIMATQPFVITLMAAALGTQRLTPATFAGLAISFAGALYLFGGDFGAGTSLRDMVIGSAMIFACGVAFSVSVVFSRPLVERYGSLRVSLVNLILIAIPALPFYSANIPGIVASLDLFAWMTLVYLGLIGTIIASVTWNFAVGKLPPATLGASLYVVPLLSALGGWLILGEAITLHTILAGLIILAGVAVSEFGHKLLPAKTAP